MIPPENPPASKQGELRSKQVPWGAPKPKSPAAPPAPPPGSAPEPTKAVLSAKKIPWGAPKAPAAAPTSPASNDAMVTHMPWAEPSRPPLPTPAAPLPPAPAPKPGMFAKLVPWGARKSASKNPPPAAEAPEEPAAATMATWALPKGSAAPSAQQEMEFARDLRRPDDSGEPTAEQLVAFLSRLTSRRKDPAAMSAALDARAPYKARPISFVPTRQELIVMWVRARWRRVSAGAILFLLMLATAYLWRLVSLNAEIDRQWRVMETSLRDRYALVPAYVDCIRAFSDTERYTMTLTERGLTAWRDARTDFQVAQAAGRMEMVLTQLSKVMRRYDQSVPAKEEEEAASAERFAQLERQREISRRQTSELVQAYNASVLRYNAKVEGIPGLWIAWIASLRERAPIFSGARQ